MAAAKATDAREIMEAIAAGVTIIGENYVQEAERAHEVVGNKAEWHFIGHLQKNKVKKAVEIFDMIETVDSVEIAREIDKRCAQIGKTMPVLIEINSGRENQKTGVYPENAEQLITEISTLKNIRVMGLMTMGPRLGNPEDARPYFVETRKIFDRIKKLNLPERGNEIPLDGYVKFLPDCPGGGRQYSQDRQQDIRRKGLIIYCPPLRFSPLYHPCFFFPPACPRRYFTLSPISPSPCQGEGEEKDEGASAPSISPVF